MKPLAIELFAGTMSWTAGWRELGGYSVGFDIEHLPHHGLVPKGADLVIQDVLTLHGSQFRNASLIVASPPCQNYSYLAMPWSKSTDWVRPSGDGWEVLNSAKAKLMRETWEREGPDNRLFDDCFRIQREASEAAGRYIPMVVENVRGSRKWVGAPFKANYGSFVLYGDVGMVGKRIVRADAGFGAAGLSGQFRKVTHAYAGRGSFKTVNGDDWRHASNAQGGAEKVPGFLFDGSGRSFQTAAVESTGVKVPSESGRRTDVGNGARFTSRDCGVEADGPKSSKDSGGWFNDYKGEHCVGMSRTGSKSSARKAASAQIAMIPPALSRHIAEIFWPGLPLAPERGQAGAEQIPAYLLAMGENDMLLELDLENELQNSIDT